MTVFKFKSFQQKQENSDLAFRYLAPTLSVVKQTIGKDRMKTMVEKVEKTDEEIVVHLKPGLVNAVNGQTTFSERIDSFSSLLIKEYLYNLRVFLVQTEHADQSLNSKIKARVTLSKKLEDEFKEFTQLLDGEIIQTNSLPNERIGVSVVLTDTYSKRNFLKGWYLSKNGDVDSVYFFKM